MMFRIGRKPNPNWAEIHQLLKQGAARQDRTDRQLARTDRQLEQFAKQQEERDQAWWTQHHALQAAWNEQRERDQAAQEKQRERDRIAQEKQRAQDKEAAKRTRQEIGGMAHNLGNIAEEHFMLAWDECRPVLIGDIEFDEVLANEKYRAHGKEMECDLVLLNGTHIGIVEVKLFLHSKDVTAFDTKLRDVLPVVLPVECQHLQVMPVMACLGMSDGARTRIEAHGFALLRPDGQQSKLEIEHLRPRPPVGKLPPRA